MPQSIPSGVVDKDHELESRSTKSTEALAKHRWHHTLDPKGPGYSFGAYAEAVGRSTTVIRSHANGYALFVERAKNPLPGSELDMESAFRLAQLGAEQQQFSEAIAEGSGEPVGRVARGDNASRRGAIIEQARQRAERRGTDPVAEAREIATRQRQTREMDTRRRSEKAERTSLRYIEVEGRLAGAQRYLRQAMEAAERVEFTTEEMELLRTSIDNIRALLNLLDLRMAGQVDIDWETELANLGIGGQR